MFIRRVVSVVSVAVAIHASAAAAELLPAPTVEYVADSAVEFGTENFHSRLYYAPHQVMINRLDKGVVWLLVPEKQMYMEIRAGEAPPTGDISGFEVQRTAMGREQVNGIDTTKFKVIMTSPADETYEGFMWMSESGLLMRVDAQSGEDIIRMELTNVVIQTQDPKLFEIPPRYKRTN